MGTVETKVTYQCMTGPNFDCDGFWFFRKEKIYFLSWSNLTKFERGRREATFSPLFPMQKGRAGSASPSNFNSGAGTTSWASTNGDPSVFLSGRLQALPGASGRYRATVGGVPEGNKKVINVYKAAPTRSRKCPRGAWGSLRQENT